MKKRAYKLLSTLLVLCVALALLPGTARAAETSGKCGENVTWSYSDGVLTIQGTGPMESYDLLSGTPWGLIDVSKSVKGSIRTANIGDGVTSIGDFAFCERKELTGVSIPDSVTSIGVSAFALCSSLTSMIIPDTVTSIGANAFLQCENLTSVTISKGVTSIESQVLSYCPSLTSVTIPASVTNIAQAAFYGSDNLKDVYYGGSESQWKQVSIDNSNDRNAPLLNAAVHCNGGADTDPAPSTSDSRSALSVTVNGTAVMWTGAIPFIDANGRTMVPLRAAADAMSLEVSWDAAAREASFTDGSKTIYFPIGSIAARTGDGGTVQMDTAAVISNDRTYAPIRYLAEFFGYTVGWDAAAGTVLITK